MNSKSHRFDNQEVPKPTADVTREEAIADSNDLKQMLAEVNAAPSATPSTASSAAPSAAPSAASSAASSATTSTAPSTDTSAAPNAATSTHLKAVKDGMTTLVIDVLGAKPFASFPKAPEEFVKKFVAASSLEDTIKIMKLSADALQSRKEEVIEAANNAKAKAKQNKDDASRPENNVQTVEKMLDAAKKELAVHNQPKPTMDQEQTMKLATGLLFSLLFAWFFLELASINIDRKGGKSIRRKKILRKTKKNRNV